MENLELGRQLVQWYKNNARTLPWREDPTPYKTWISEIMLQQTRVEAVIPYFLRFTKEIPDVLTLARVDDDLLHKLWEGLGYYSRCRNLKNAAKILVESHDGKIPGSYELLLSLPGIGPYTAGAIASISFEQPFPAVDGNVLRVVTRIHGIEEDIGKTDVKKKVASLVLDMMPVDEPGQFNQALMELGATVCIPSSEPRCHICPWSAYCISKRDDLTARIPKKEKKKKRRVDKMTVFVLVCGNLVLLRKRRGEGLLKGMWEFPNSMGHLTQEKAESWAESLGLEKFSAVPIGKAKHLFTHVEWDMEGYLIEVDQPLAIAQSQWVTLEDLQHRFALPSAFKYYKKKIT